MQRRTDAPISAMPKDCRTRGLGAGADPLTLPRVKIEGGEGMGMFRLAASGGLDAWSLVDRSLYVLQKPA